MRYFMKKKTNRGRFQAQGQVLEQSEKWAQDDPIYHCEAKELIEKLKKKLKKRELEIRKKAFKQCENYVDRAQKNGGINAFISISFPKNYKERVDIEIRKGLAFKTKPVQK